MLRDRLAHPSHALISFNLVENLQCSGRKPPGFVREAKVPANIDETTHESDDNGFGFYGQWFMRVLGFQVHVCESGCRVFHVVEIGGFGPSVTLVSRGVPCYDVRNNVGRLGSPM